MEFVIVQHSPTVLPEPPNISSRPRVSGDVETGVRRFPSDDSPEYRFW